MNKQLNSNNFTLAVAIHNPGEELLKALEKVHSQKLDDETYFFAYNSEFDGEYDEIADIGEEDLNANLTLGLYNDYDGMFYPSDTLTETLANQGGVGKDDISVDFLSSIDPNDYDDEINDEVKRIKSTYYASDSIKDNVIEKKKAENKEAVESSNKEQTSSKKNERIDPQDQLVDKNSSSNPDDHSQNDLLNEDQSNPNESEPTQENLAQAAYDEANIDPLLTMSAEMFRNKCTTQIPQFDQWTTEQIRPAIVEANLNLSKEQDNAIFAIYDKLVTKRDELERNFEDTIKPETEKHEQVIKTIKDNQAVQIKDVKSQAEKNYKKDKENYVQSQRPVLENKFDSEHRKEYDQTVAEQVSNIENQTQEKIDQENLNYDNWRAEQEDHYLSEHLEKVDITPEINDFQKKAEIQINHLKEAAQNFIDQVAVVTKNVEEKRKQAVAKYQQAQQTLQTFKDTFEERVEAETAKKVNEQTHDIQEKLRKVNAENDQQRETIHEMSQQNVEESQQAARKHNDELNARDDQWREKIAKIQKDHADEIQRERSENEAMMHEKDAEIKRIKDEKGKAETDAKTMRDLVQQLQRRSFDQSRYIDEPLVQQTHRRSINEQSIEPRKSDHERKSKMSVGTKIALTVMGIATVGSVGFGAYTIGQNNSQNVQQINSTQSQSQTLASDSDNSTKQYQKGDTWTYTGPDHKKYTVTMISPTKGHYKDANGITRTIVVPN